MASNSWQPTASIETLAYRAQVLAKIRDFFHQRQAMEVDTPILSQAATTDLHLDSIHTNQGYLHTSPEYPMKRLLAAGSGAIYQLCKVFRAGEQSQRHNSEFTLLEWYRPNWSDSQLRDEVRDLLGLFLPTQQVQTLSYQQVFQQYIQLDPHGDDLQKLQNAAAQQGLSGADTCTRDECLDFLISVVIEPQLPKDFLVFITDYPASQAALAEKHQNDQGHWVAKRFEAYFGGLELANGYFELTDAGEQRQRFKNDNEQRAKVGKSTMPMDEHFLAALDAGLPACSGVALGVDRLIMLACGAQHIDEVVAFPFHRA